MLAINFFVAHMMCIYHNTPKVAVKIIHPAVREVIEIDLKLMNLCAYFMENVFGLQSLSLCESVDEFSNIMLQQIDFTIEAKNLLKFREKFGCDSKNPNSRSKNITFPKPIPNLVREGVLVETYQPGVLMTDLLKDDKLHKSVRQKLAKLGLEAILKMTFEYNFIHGDLHPGHIYFSL